MTYSVTLESLESFFFPPVETIWAILALTAAQVEDRTGLIYLFLCMAFVLPDKSSHVLFCHWQMWTAILQDTAQSRDMSMRINS